ncbi:MAG: helix-turn-helix transcriptional regulator [Clostridia bacterium]|nr:helix-turn-helix transcriptional regulator [Clostridia bacterium]
MANLEKKFFSIGNLTKKNSLATFDSATPWKEANIAFNWLNFEYPLIHGHTDWEILLALQGHILHQINGTSEVLIPGTGCLIGPKDKHALFYPNKTKNDFQGVSIIIRDSYMRDFLHMYTPTLYNEILTHQKPLYFSISNNSIEKYTNLLLSIQNFDAPQTVYCQQQCNIVFTYLILKIMEQQVSPFSFPNELKDFVRQLNNPSITREKILELQEALPYSYSQLARIFKKYTNSTITQYVNQVKMNYAKELLSGTEMPIAAIAEELQFDSTAHFHTLFKRTFHTTPLHYRKNG